MSGKNHEKIFPPQLIDNTPQAAVNCLIDIKERIVPKSGM
jgi:hypothetical protein